MSSFPEGFRIGHWTDPAALTGCTVILCPPRTVGSCDVRGSSPGSRELGLLAPDKTMQEVHAVLLTGGSAFGLAAADGVMRFLEENGTGYQTPWARVPIVPGAVIFDLNVGDGTRRPDAGSGYAACEAASDEPAQGSVGAGMGATVGKWGGMEGCMKGGFGIAGVRRGDLCVAACAVVNAVGDILDSRMTVIAGARLPDGSWRTSRDPHRLPATALPAPHTNTTLIVVATNARLDKVSANRLAQRAHDGVARSVKPCHTSFDGDIVFGLAMGTTEAPFDEVAELGADVTAEAIRNGVLHAASAAGIPAVNDLA